METLEFQVSDEILENPSRGFYIQVDSDDADKFEELREEGIRLTLLAFEIGEFKDTIMSDDKLEELSYALGMARNNRIKVIFRAAYKFDEDYEDPKDFESIITHIQQIAPVLNEYSDTILCVQAGFLGPWGEWHGSKFLEDGEEEAVVYRNQVLSALLEHLDDNIIINLRRPKFIRAAELAGLSTTRLGIHNDALLSTEDDMATYDEEGYTRSDELDWVDTTIQTHINGGEMPMVGDYSGIDNAVKEFEKLHITYLNSQYNTEVLEQWNTQKYQGENGLDYISKHLGYRYNIDQIKLPRFLKRNRNIQMKGTIQNTGFASIEEGYNLYLVIQNQKDDINYKKVDHISFDKEKVSFDLELQLPNVFDPEIEGTQLIMGLMLTDDLPEKGNVDACVQFANRNMVFENGVNEIAYYEYEKNKYVLGKRMY